MQMCSSVEQWIKHFEASIENLPLSRHLERGSFMRISSRFKVNTTITLVVLFALSLTFVISQRGTVHAAGPKITLFPKTGSPNISTQVTGKSFGLSETVALTFD